VALYRFSVKIISRRAGQSAVASAAYRAGETLYSTREGKAFAFPNPERVKHAEILAPAGAAAWVFDREQLWNAVERSEKRSDSQLAREVQLALPVELDEEAQLALVREFIQDEFVSRGMVADFAIHRNEGDDPQPHVHIMLTMRELGLHGFRKKNTNWNSPRLLKHWREAWEHYVNRALAKAGRSERVDHRSYKDRGIDLTPQPKRGRYQTKSPFQDRRDRTLDMWNEWLRVARENGDTISRSPSEALSALTSNQSTFTRKELLRFLNGHTADAEQFAECLHSVLRDKDLVSLGKDDFQEEHFTTRQVLVQEEGVIDDGYALVAQKNHRVRASHIEQASKEKTLTPDQHNVLEHLTRRTGGLAVVSGYAGTGKSWMLGAARLVWEAEGYVVVGAALAGKAAAGLHESSGIESRTLARWELAWSLERDLLTQKHIIVIDEAGMVGTAQMGRVLAHARDVGAKVIIVGDAEQLQPIAAGSPMRVLRDKMNATAVLADIQRQKEEWQKQATLAFAQTRPLDGLYAYADHGDIYEHSKHTDARDAVIASWERDERLRPTVRTTGKDGLTKERPATSILLSYRRRDVRALNDGVRALRRAAGALGPDHRILVRDRDGVQHEQAFAKGDRLYFLANNTPMAVMNGTLGTVQEISGTTMTVMLDENRELTFDTTAYDEFDHGYAGTVHKGQGVTVDRAYVLASTPFDSGATYVAMTRHRESVELHWGHDEFQPRSANPQVRLPDFTGAIALHPDPDTALAAVLDEWRASLDHGTRPTLLVAPTAEEARTLNLEARQVAELDGRLGADLWVRTLAGARVFAVGDRVQISNAIPELALERGALGTLLHHEGQVLSLQLDDGRTVQLDTAQHRDIDHGYAVSLEQTKGMTTERAIVFGVERLDDLARERIAAPNLGQVSFHGLEGSNPTLDTFLEAISRERPKEHAFEIREQLEQAQSFAATSDHRSQHDALPEAERASYRSKLEAAGGRAPLSLHEALLALPEVQEAYWTVMKAESTLQEQLAHRAAFREQAGVVKKVGEFFTDRRIRELANAEAAVGVARQHFDALLEQPELRARAAADAAAHNRQLGQAYETARALTEEHTRPDREVRLAERIERLNARAVSQHRWSTPMRIAQHDDFGRDMRFVAVQRLGVDDAVICRDDKGGLVAFDAARFGSDLAAVQKDHQISVSSAFELTVHPMEHTNVEMGHERD
jgi:Ti-type conjugative transfer relaxase TraA